ncbi:hypothetical protein GCM10022280_21890 [Sphingomonas swuensis]|uniref:Uncharacterized protein n=1 Tax=Sphingomonas swuensis TaxID=977800 RepID=A0ABP7T4V2_9SPHN
MVWTQGCALACEGCFNPDSHAKANGEIIEVPALARQVNASARASGLRGLTLSGGEPLAQARAVAHLLDRLDPALDVLLFTGHELAEIRRSSVMRAVIARCDAVLAGRYSAANDHPFAGKSLLLRGGRIRADELTPHHIIELVVGTGPNATVTGYPRRKTWTSTKN